MANPIHVDGMTTRWWGKGDVGSLPALITEKGESVSCWELDADELAEIARTGKVWLHVWGAHPAVYVAGVAPLELAESAEKLLADGADGG